MRTSAITVEAYFESLAEERRRAVSRLRQIACGRLVPPFEETMSSVGISYSVPLSRYPAGYHCTPGEPLPFLAIASQARHIAVYHLGLYADPDLQKWFTERWKTEAKNKLDMGKSCIRMANPEKIPFELFDELFSRMDMDRFIAIYERSRRAENAPRQS